MRDGRIACCLNPATKQPCNTRFAALRLWVTTRSGKGVRLVELGPGEQGKAPFFAQPVGYDGRAFFVAPDYGCDTEKLLHEYCHWLLAPKARRVKPNYGLGPGFLREVSDEVADNEEVTVMLLERLLAPHFALADNKIAKPDYNVADRRNVDWDGCAERAKTVYEDLFAQIPAP